MRRRTFDGVETVLIETYAPRDSMVAALADGARGAAQEMARRGHDVRYVQTIFVPADETCFHLFEAASVAALTAGTRDTALYSGRVVRASHLLASGAPNQRKENSCPD